MKWSELPHLNKMILTIGIVCEVAVVSLFLYLNLLCGLFMAGFYTFFWWLSER